MSISSPIPSTAIFCLTADEAFPEYERHFLAAEEEVLVSFRIFEPMTRLRSAEGQAIGRDWFDLLVHVLRRGVRVVLYISDFDPIAAAELHRGTWSSVRQILAAAEFAGPGAAHLEVVPAAHPARVGLLPRLVLWPRIQNELRRRAGELNRMTPPLRRRALSNMPCLAPYLSPTGKGVRPKLTLPELIPATHHQKVAVFDRKRLAVGGLDLNERRYDTLRHEQSPEDTWHDVQMFLDDATRAEAAARHILSLQRVTGGTMRPGIATGLSRTLSRRRSVGLCYLSPRTIVNEISRVHRERIGQSERLIYLETQFLRDLQTANRLARAARNNPDLRLILIIPAAPEDVAFGNLRRADARLGEFLQTRCMRMVRRAFGSRVFIGAPVQPRRHSSTGRDALWGGPIIYVHAKVSIFDEKVAMVSSANLNGRSLYWDTELGIEITRESEVRHLKKRCFDHWLPDNVGPEFYRLETACDAWRGLAVENLNRAPEERRGFILPYDPTPAERFGRDVLAVPNEIV